MLPPRMGASARLAFLLAVAAAPAHAQSYRLLVTGALDARSSLVSGATTTPLAASSPFTLTAFFNTTSPNLVAPIGAPGFVAYTPTSVQLTIGGVTYAVQPFDATHPTGVSVAIFDATSPFGPPGRYGVGLIQNPLADGAGFIADYTGATPAFTTTALVPTTFTGYAGVGVSSGVCTAGTPAACTAHAVTPIPLSAAGQSYALILGNYEDNAGPGVATFAASISAVPEPASVLLVATGLVGVAVARRRRTRRA